MFLLRFSFYFRYEIRCYWHRWKARSVIGIYFTFKLTRLSPFFCRVSGVYYVTTAESAATFSSLVVRVTYLSRVSLEASFVVWG